MEHEIQTSRGKIRVVDSHVFEIEIPDSEQVVVVFRGKAFRIAALADESENVSYDGKRVDKSQN